MDRQKNIRKKGVNRLQNAKQNLAREKSFI